jgi:hypothetical protein
LERNEPISLIKLHKNAIRIGYISKRGCHVVSKAFSKLRNISREQIFIEYEGHIIRESDVLKRLSMTWTKAKVELINYVTFLNVPVENS